LEKHMSNVQDLKTKRNAAAVAFNNLNDDPAFQELRRTTQEKFNIYKEKSAEADRLFKTRAPKEQIDAANLATQQALSDWKPYDNQYQPLFKQAAALRNEVSTLDAQIAEIGNSDTSPQENVTETQRREQTAAATSARNDSSPQPPTEQENLSTAEDDPEAYSPANPQASFVFSQDQINFIESYNENLVESGNSDLVVDTDSPEALDVLIRTGRIRPDDDGFPVEQQTVDEDGISVTISGVGFEEFQDDGGFGEETSSSTAGGFIGEEESPAPQVQPLVNTAREQTVGRAAPDWRVRIQLADQADYFYNSANPGILAPLRSTNGVLFPYLPQITVTYSSSYTPLDVVHTNYKFYSYKNSSVDSVMISADFTAQNTVEANYLLAVIHFFRSVGKMFYGQDQNPSRGIPPPICYLSGHGEYQFNKHPMVLTSFTYNLPVDVDYISAYPTNPTSSIGGVDLAPYTPTAARSFSPLDRLRSLVSSGIAKGGLPPPPNFQRSQNISEITRVPTKMNMQLTFLPIATRNAVSNKFSLKDYASGSLLRGSVNPGTGGGFW
jgi:hypothetical protein